MAAQEPHPLHKTSSILLSASEIAPKGQEATQRPQDMHLRSSKTAVVASIPHLPANRSFRAADAAADACATVS